MYVSRRLREYGAWFAPKLPDSCSRKEGESRIPKVPFCGKNGGTGTCLNGHLSWAEIPVELILWPANIRDQKFICDFSRHQNLIHTHDSECQKAEGEENT